MPGAHTRRRREKPDYVSTLRVDLIGPSTRLSSISQPTRGMCAQYYLFRIAFLDHTEHVYTVFINDVLTI